MFFTSLITPLILLVLYITFLGNVYRDSFSSALPPSFQISEKLMELLEGESPEAMYDNQANEMVREFDMRLRSQGLDMKTYMQYMGMDANALKGMYKEEAEKRVKLRLALEAVARKENIEVTEADLDAEYGKMAEAYKMDVDKVKEAVPAESLTEDVKVEKALNLVKDKAVIK